MEKYLIPNLSKACHVLKELAKHEQGMSAAEIAQDLSIPRTTAFRILRTLVHEGLVEKAGRVFHAGPGLVEIGSRVLSQVRVREQAIPVLQRLTRETGETAQLAVLSGLHSLILEVCDSPNPIRVASRPGTLADLHCSATGKVFLAYLYGDQLETILPSLELHRRTANTITDLKRLEVEVRHIQQQGYAVDDEEYYEGARCLAAPVWQSGMQVVASVGITATVQRFVRGRIPEVARVVVAGASELSRFLGG